MTPVRNMLIGYPDWSDAATITSATAAAAGSLVGHLQTMQPSDVYAAATAGGIFIRLDRGSAEPANVAALLFHNGSGTGTWRLRMGDAAITTGPPTVLADSHATNVPMGLTGTPHFWSGGIRFPNPPVAAAAATADASYDSSSWTFECWLHPDVLRQEGIWRWGTSRRLQMLATTGLVRFDDTGANGVTSSVPLGPGLWTHVACVFDNVAGERRLYFDGNLVGTQTGAVLTGVGTGNVRLANDLTAVQFAGAMRDVRLWTTARTQPQIADNKDGFVSPASSGLVANWRCNDFLGVDTGALPLWAQPGLDALPRRHALYVFPLMATHRYARVEVTDAAIAEFQCGRLVLGNFWEPEKNYDFGIQRTHEDFSTRQRTLGGANIVGRRGTAEGLVWTIPAIRLDEVHDAYLPLIRARAGAADVTVIANPEDTAHLYNQISYGLLDQQTFWSHEHPGLADLRFRLEGMA